METVTFDTHQAVKAITRPGLNDTQAEAIVTTITTAMNQSLATKSDFLALRVDMERVRVDMEALRVDMEALRGEFLVLKWMVGVIIVVEVLPHLKFLFA